MPKGPVTTRTTGIDEIVSISAACVKIFVGSTDEYRGKTSTFAKGSDET